MALSGPVSSKARLVAETRFDGPKSTHGSVTRWNSPPADDAHALQGDVPPGLPAVEVVPKTRLRAPPVDHRSSCHADEVLPAVRRVDVYPWLRL